MNYELAKKLKETGFPKPKSGEYLEMTEEIYENKHECVFPTLSELIEACGEDFDALYGPYSSLNNHEGIKIRDWRCDATNRTGISVEGKTPEEAVAQLWLTINKNKL